MVPHPGEGCQTQRDVHGMAPHCGSLDPQFSQQVSGGAATPISSTLGRYESGTPPGCGALPAPLPGGRRPEKPSATSGYRLATLRVGCSRMSKLLRMVGTRSYQVQGRKTRQNVGGGLYPIQSSSASICMERWRHEGNPNAGTLAGAGTRIRRCLRASKADCKSALRQNGQNCCRLPA